MAKPAISILIPTYNKADLLRQCLESVLAQDFADYEIIVSDDCSTDNTADVVRAVSDGRIHYFRNAVNRGYGGNLSAGAAHASGAVLFLLGHDDILLPAALRRTWAAFESDPSIGLVTRPYYWFDRDPHVPVRVVPPYDTRHDTVLSIDDGCPAIRALFTSAGQLSGLAFRRSYMEAGFHTHIFTAHIYPFADVLKRSRAVYLRHYTIAVRIESSMTRHRPDIYRPSPTATWIEMFTRVFAGDRYTRVRACGIDFITAENHVGLLQLRNHAGTQVLVKEIGILLGRRSVNALSFKFWFYVGMSLLVPSAILSPLVDAYKRQILSRRLMQKNLV